MVGVFRVFPSGRGISTQLSREANLKVNGSIQFETNVKQVFIIDDGALIMIATIVVVAKENVTGEMRDMFGNTDTKKTLINLGMAHSQ